MAPRGFLPRWVWGFSILLCLGGWIPVASGQTVTGTIVGTVTDPTGAVIPGAKVSVTNEKTKVSIVVQTNDAGQYGVPFLQPGEYSVEAEHANFKRRVVRGVIVEVEQRVRIDVEMEVGAVTEVVEVTSQAALLQTETSSIGQVIDNRKVVDLPLNGRQFMELAYLVPATHKAAPGHYNEILQGFAVTSGGGRPTNNNFTLDGVDNVSPNCGYFAVSPSVDAVQEFKIQTSNYSAEFGRTGGAVVNVATKSGTNEFHGTLFEFVRNDIFDARNTIAFEDRDGDGKADAEQIRRNQFGGSIGGPIVRNKTFFFYNQEHLKERKPRVQTSPVPTSQMKAGDFSNAGYTIYDPNTTQADGTRTAFLNNMIPSNRISPVAQAILASYPDPNRPGGLFQNLEATRWDTTQIITRVDHHLSATDSFYARYGHTNSSIKRPGPIPGLGVDNLRYYGRNAAANWTHTFSPQFVNEFRAGYNRLNFARESPNAGTDFAGQLGIQGVPATRISAFPVFGISGFVDLFDIEPYGNIDNIYQLTNIASYIRGRHSMRFGIDVRRIQNDYFIVRSPSGSYSLNGQYTSAAVGEFLPDGLADLLLGAVSSKDITYLGDIGRHRTTNWNAFFQNDWKVTPNLTLNLGLRYELFTPPKDKFGRQGWMDPATGEMVYPRTAPLNDPIPGSGITEADLPFPFRRVDRDQIMIGDNNNFAPRFGFAYNVPFLRNTVVRGGYGVSYVYFPFSDFGAITQRMLPFAIRPSASGNPSVPDQDFNFDVGGARAALLGTTRSAVAGLDPDLRWADAQQWNLNIQHELPGNWLFEIGHIGNIARHLGQRYLTNLPLTPGLGSLDPRRPFPFYAGVSQVQSDINNNYYALTGRLEKRFSSGYSLLTTYTWAKSLGYGSEVYGTPAQESGIQNPLNRRIERGNAPDDIRHRLSIAGVWELPFGKGKRLGADAPRGVNYLISGWQVNSIMAFQTGFRLSATGGAFTNMGWSTRPDQICDPNKGFTFTTDQVFNTSCFVRPALVEDPVLAAGGITRFGTAMRGSLETPDLEVVDFSILKNSRIGENLNIQFRFEMFNMFNHVNFSIYDALPVRSFDSGNFGRIFAADDPRLIQLGLKLIF